MASIYTLDRIHDQQHEVVQAAVDTIAIDAMPVLILVDAVHADVLANRLRVVVQTLALHGFDGHHDVTEVQPV